MTVDRNLLADALGRGTYARVMLESRGPERALLQGQQISQFAMDSNNFGSGMAGTPGILAQLATAGVGAYTQYKAEEAINERELASQAQFARRFPDLADIASVLSAETRDAYTLQVLKDSLKSAEPLSGIGKIGADYRAGLIDEPTYKAVLKKETSFAPDSASGGGATGAIVSNLRRENPKLSYAQALAMSQGLARQGLRFDDSGGVTPLEGLTESKEKLSAAETRGKETGKKEGEIGGKVVAAPQILSLTSEAAKLLPEATSGRLEGLVTSGAGIAGISTKASRADARLRVIAADLISNVPRMEGPQSDKDTELYKQAAGDIANRNLPYEDRLAALRTIKEKNQKYLRLNQSQQTAAGGFRILNIRDK